MKGSPHRGVNTSATHQTKTLPHSYQAKHECIDRLASRPGKKSLCLDSPPATRAPPLASTRGLPALYQGGSVGREENRSKRLLRKPRREPRLASSPGTGHGYLQRLFLLQLKRPLSRVALAGNPREKVLHPAVQLSQRERPRRAVEVACAQSLEMQDVEKTDTAGGRADVLQL